MEAASLHRQEESQFNVFPKLKSCWSNVGGAEAHGGPSLPEKPSPPSHSWCYLTNGLAPTSAGLAPTKKLVHWKTPSVVGAGLQNLGNTCYVIAVLQCLAYTPPLAISMLSQQHGETCGKQTFCMLCTLQAHMTQALCHPGDVIRPLPGLLAAFHTHKQEDAHEFLMFTLGAMQQACLPEDKPSDPQSEDTTLIRQIFGGYWRSQIQCLHCQGISSTLDPYLDISLDIVVAQSVSQALEQLVKPEKLDGENAYHCSTCLGKVPASKTLTLHTPSKVFVLVLKRFSDFTGNKMAKDVQYPECLDMQPYLCEQRPGPLVYVLYAVLVHAGWSCHREHYFCFIKAGNGQWYKMDDTKVTACDVSCALNQHAYVLFYIQKTELERELVSEPLGEGATSPEADHTGLVGFQREPKTDSRIKVPELEDHVEETSVQQITLDQWRFLQECNRPKAEFNVRKVEFALPEHAVIIHQSKYEMIKNDPEQNFNRLNTLARNIASQRAGDMGIVPCLAGRARATKKKNKKGQKSREVVQGSHY
ncbi:PREDICTED: ubiquitin carboxyl-terminal hydrolase 17-like protein 6 [Odobenus rosmarus divergens]|uniref:Ubiquitin carboxyl-terminal hydrolase 17-like protein 6 n=1 Tax=Odobenus rosmarus divergens TaxID=9708 RepID=A0A2U3WBG9_ODORO|nr:PREDICTED: ubiquitin carboxyl-terminal hydrolase 17-like protein 6 [Odobenus rosmarus divergens]